MAAKRIVLAYDFAKHTLDADAQSACLAECRRIARCIDITASEAQCKLLELARRTPMFAILKPARVTLPAPR